MTTIHYLSDRVVITHKTQVVHLDHKCGTLYMKGLSGNSDDVAHTLILVAAVAHNIAANKGPLDTRLMLEKYGCKVIP